MIQTFENTSISLRNQDAFANRAQLMELYDVPAMTLSDNIKKLKEDGLIKGTDIRTNLNNRKIEVFNLDDIIAIGLRLRSDKAIKFQRWAINTIKTQLIQSLEKLDEQQSQLDYFWDKSDNNDIYLR